jgi:hypothetical protein
MVQVSTKFIATASVVGDDGWTWYLKIDSAGLYRWYMADNASTGLRGVTRRQADNALRRFIEHSIRGKLKIIERDKV